MASGLCGEQVSRLREHEETHIIETLGYRRGMALIDAVNWQHFTPPPFEHVHSIFAIQGCNDAGEALQAALHARRAPAIPCGYFVIVPYQDEYLVLTYTYTRRSFRGRNYVKRKG